MTLDIAFTDTSVGVAHLSVKGVTAASNDQLLTFIPPLRHNIPTVIFHFVIVKFDQK